MAGTGSEPDHREAMSARGSSRSPAPTASSAARCARACVPRRSRARLVRALTDAVARADTRAVGDLARRRRRARDALRGADAVVHLAARAHVMRETRTPIRLRRFARVNVAATERVARAARRKPVRAFRLRQHGQGQRRVDAAAAGRFSESDPPAPQDDYAAQQMGGGARAARGRARQRTCRVTVLRLPLMYGPGVQGQFRAPGRSPIARGVPLPLAAIDNRRSVLGAANLVSALDALFPASDRCAAWRSDLSAGGCR